MSDLAGNPEGRFSYYEAQICMHHVRFSVLWLAILSENRAGDRTTQGRLVKYYLYLIKQNIKIFTDISFF